LVSELCFLNGAFNEKDRRNVGDKHFLFRRIMGGELVSGLLNERLSPTILPKPKPALVEKLA